MTPPSAALESAYRRLMAAVGAGREDVIAELFSAEFVDHAAGPDQPPGPAGFVQWMRGARAAFPDLTATVDEVVTARDRVAARVTYRGTHGGPFAGIPATGLAVAFPAFHFVGFRDGLIAEWWGTADLLGVLLRIGARIEPPRES